MTDLEAYFRVNEDYLYSRFQALRQERGEVIRSTWLTFLVFPVCVLVAIGISLRPETLSGYSRIGGDIAGSLAWVVVLGSGMIALISARQVLRIHGLLHRLGLLRVAMNSHPGLNLDAILVLVERQRQWRRILAYGSVLSLTPVALFGGWYLGLGLELMLPVLALMALIGSGGFCLAALKLAKLHRGRMSCEECFKGIFRSPNSGASV